MNDDYARLERCKLIQKLDKPIPKDDPRWSEDAKGWIYTILLIVACMFVLAMFTVGLVHTARFVFSYSVPVITTETEAMHELGGRLR